MVTVTTITVQHNDDIATVGQPLCFTIFPLFLGLFFLQVLVWKPMAIINCLKVKTNEVYWIFPQLDQSSLMDNEGLGLEQVAWHWWIAEATDWVGITITANSMIVTLKPQQNSQHFADDIFLWNKNESISNQLCISCKAGLKLIHFCDYW